MDARSARWYVADEMSSSDPLRPGARLLVGVGLALWLCAAIACVWEVLALQYPDSPFHAGILAGPVGQLRSYSFGLGGVLLAAAWLWPHLYGERGGRIALGLLIAGALVHVGAIGYAASQGLVAVQIVDPRPDARSIVLARGLGHALMTLALLDACLRALRGRL